MIQVFVHQRSEEQVILTSFDTVYGICLCWFGEHKPLHTDVCWKPFMDSDLTYHHLNLQNRNMGRKQISYRRSRPRNPGSLVSHFPRFYFYADGVLHSWTWKIFCLGFQLNVDWQPGVGCFFIETNNKIVAAIFIYSMCFDLLILLLNTYKLLSFSSSFGMSGGNRVAQMMFTDGLIFFVIACVVNSV